MTLKNRSDVCQDLLRQYLKTFRISIFGSIDNCCVWQGSDFPLTCLLANKLNARVVRAKLRS